MLKNQFIIEINLNYSGYYKLVIFYLSLILNIFIKFYEFICF